jgi:hypothetical protein
LAKASAPCRPVPAADREPAFEVRVNDQVVPGNVLGPLAALLLSLARREAAATEKGGTR